MFTRPFCNLFPKEDTSNCLSFRLHKPESTSQTSQSAYLWELGGSGFQVSVLHPAWKGRTLYLRTETKGKASSDPEIPLPDSDQLSTPVIDQLSTQSLPYSPSTFKSRNQALADLLFPAERWWLVHGTQDTSLNRSLSSLLGGSGRCYTRGVGNQGKEPPPKIQTPFGQRSQRSVSLVKRINNKACPCR